MLAEMSLTPPDDPTLRVVWIIIAVFIGLIVTGTALLTGLWALGTWVKNQVKTISDTSNKEALSSDEHKKFIREIVSSSFTGYAEAGLATIQEMKNLRERLELHENTEKVWHDDTRKTLQEGGQRTAMTLMQATGEWIRERDAQIEDLRTSRDEHDKRISALEGQPRDTFFKEPK